MLDLDQDLVFEFGPQAESLQTEGDDAGASGLDHLQGDSLVKPEFAKPIDLKRIATDIRHAGGIATTQQRERDDFRHAGNRREVWGRTVGLRLILNSHCILSS